MAFVTLFVPEDFLNIPTHGSIQYHPSLLPAYRGASAINWPIIKGEKETGLSIFWPDNGLDTGDVLMQKKTPISDTDTLGTVYFDRLFPMGVEAMLESVDLVKAGKAPRIKQDESKATYEGKCGPATPDRLGQAVGADRPADPRLQSGARRLDHARRQDREGVRRQADAGARSEGIAGKLGEIVAVDADGITVVCADGRFKVTRVQADGPKVGAREWAKGANVAAGARFTCLIVVPRKRTRNPAQAVLRCRFRA
jgi:methionyl-tRNA formyltransferase